MARTAFKLRSPSPFKQDQAVAQEGGENVLKNVNVNKGEKSIYTYKKMHADILKNGGSQAEADSQVADARKSNLALHGTHNPTKEGKTENYRSGPDTMDTEDIKVDPTEGKKGDMMNSFSPSETRGMIRERKIQKNRKDKYENKNRRQTGRYDKALKNFKGTKEEFDQTKRGKRLNMKKDQSSQDASDYATGYARSQMANQQGANERDGTMVEHDPDNVSMQAATASTPGADKTILSDKDAEGYDKVSDIKANLSQGTDDSTYTESLSGGEGGGSGEAANTTETTETANSEVAGAGSKLTSNIKAFLTGGPVGLALNQDADGDGDTWANDSNNDGNMISRGFKSFMGKIAGLDPTKAAAGPLPDATDDKQVFGSGAPKFGGRGGAPFKLRRNR